MQSLSRRSLMRIGLCAFLIAPALGWAEETPPEMSPQETQATPSLDAEPEIVTDYDAAEYDQGDIAWMLTSSALVLMMTAPALFLFYGGLVRKKNVLSVFMQCLALCGMNSILWVVVCYSLAFSDAGTVVYTFDQGTEDTDDDKAITLVGGFDKVMLQGLMPQERVKRENKGTEEKPQWVKVKDDKGEDVTEIFYPSSGAIPELLFMVFQMMFFIITPALICGAFAERMKFSAMVAFTALWGIFIYCPLAHWVWGPNNFFGGGSPFQSLDFAGGLVVHASSGISALVCALFLGKRLGYGKEPIVPHNMTYAAMGAALLWVGWFGFNAGSALGSTAGAANAFVVTHICAASALVGWAVAEWLMIGKPTILGASSGIVAGLVVITPASGFVTAPSALIMGLIAGVICFLACSKVKMALGYDDSLDAFGVHGIGGMAGAILTGVFADAAVSGSNGVDIPSNVFVNQLISVGITAAFCVVGTSIILALVGATIGLRVKDSEEIEGLDSTQHGESGYVFG